MTQKEIKNLITFWLKNWVIVIPERKLSPDDSQVIFSKYLRKIYYQPYINFQSKGKDRTHLNLFSEDSLNFATKLWQKHNNNGHYKPCISWSRYENFIWNTCKSTKLTHRHSLAFKKSVNVIYHINTTGKITIYSLLRNAKN